MDRRKIGVFVLTGGLVLGAASTASALQTQGRATMEQDQARADKRALRERIRSTHEEYRALNKANDPRAEQVRLELESLKSEWKARYGADDQNRQRGDAMKQKHKERKQLKQHKR